MSKQDHRNPPSLEKHPNTNMKILKLTKIFTRLCLYLVITRGFSPIDRGFFTGFDKKNVLNNPQSMFLADSSGLNVEARVALTGVVYGYQWTKFLAICGSLIKILQTTIGVEKLKSR